ncbi:MAG: OmpA family protein [Bdellovibrionia bacterium]
MIPSKIFRQICLGLTASLMVFAVGCASAKKTEDSAPTASTAPGADDNGTLGDSDSGKALGLQTINFPYDTYTLDESGKATLKANAEILKAQPGLKIQIEGHCDQRGGIQYNIALGEKRANIAKKYLQELGIPETRMTVISFGKEKPIDTGTSEDSYAKNRRDNFVITSR